MRHRLAQKRQILLRDGQGRGEVYDAAERPNPYAFIRKRLFQRAQIVDAVEFHHA